MFEKVWFVVIIVVALIVSVWMMTDAYFSIPDVYTSYSSGECVKIMIDGTELSCKHLPEFSRYNNIWVK